MKPVVCIPWRDSGEPSRSAAFEWCWRWWHYNDLPVVMHSGPGGAFNIAAARNMAATQAMALYDADVLVFADADTVPEIATVSLAMTLAEQQLGAVYPHDHYWSLNAYTTGLVLASDPGKPQLPMPLDRNLEGPVNRASVAGCIVTSARSWSLVGGFDERFTCWGGEDTAYALVMRDVLGSALRLPGQIWHLWHSRDQYPTTRSDDHALLVADYERAAVEGPHALRSLAEIRDGAPWL